MPDAATALQILGAAISPPSPSMGAPALPAKSPLTMQFGTPDLGPGHEMNVPTPEQYAADDAAKAASTQSAAAATANEPPAAPDPNSIGAKLDILGQASAGKLPAPPPQPPAATMASTTSNIGAGANDAIAGGFGAPVDALTWALNKAHDLIAGPPARSLSDLITGQQPSPWISSPIGGSDSIKSLMGMIGADPRNIPTDNATERVARGTGAGIAGMALPFGAARAVGQIAGRAIPVVDAFGHGTLTGNATMGATAGAAGAGAEEATPEPYKPLANFGGQILGGGLAAAGAAGGGAMLRAGTQYAKDLAAPFYGAGQERLAGQRIIGAASNPGALGGALDVENPQIVPGSSPTTFQLSGDRGIGNLERAVAAQSPDPFLARRAEQNAARVGAISGLAPAGANSGAVSQLLKQHLADLDANTQSLVDAAQARGSKAVATLGGSQNGTQYGRGLRDQLATAKAAAKKRESSLWQAIDPNGTLRLDASPVRKAAGKIEKEIPATAKPMDAEERAIFGHAKMAGNAMSFQELTALRGRLLSAIRDERFNNGETPALRRMTQLREAVDDAISTAADRQAESEAQAVASGQTAQQDTSFARIQSEIAKWKADRDARAGERLDAGHSDIVSDAGGSRGISTVRGGQSSSRGGSGNAPGDQGVPGEEPVANFDDGAATRYRGAANATRERAQTFGAGPVGDVLRQGKGGLPNNVADSQVAGRFFNKGSKSFEDVNSFLKAAGGRPEAVALLKDYAAASLREAAENPDGTLNVTKFNKWMADHEGAMRVFPELAEKFNTVAKAQRSIDAALSTRKAAMDSFQNGVAKHFLGDVEPADAVKAAFSRPDKGAAFAELARLTSGSADARAGLQKAIVEHIEKNLIGNTEAGEAGNALIKADQFQTFLKKNRSALSWVFPKEQMDAMEAVAADLQRANRSIAGSKLPGGSNTTQDLAARAKHQVEQHGGSVLSMIVALGVEHGTESVFAAGAALVGVKVMEALRNAGLKRVNDLVTQAMLDPQLAHALIRKVQASGKPDAITVQTIVSRLGAIAGTAAVKNAAR